MTRKDNWYLSVSDLRRALGFTRVSNAFGKFSVVVWRSRQYIYNDQTQNIIAVIGTPNPGQPSVLRYRPRSWYAPILEQWAINHDYIPLASSNVGRRHRRIMRIVPTLIRPSRETINDRMRRTVSLPDGKVFRDPFLKMLSKDHRSDEPDEIEIDAHDLNLFPPLAASASGVIDEASMRQAIEAMSESEQTATISPSTSATSSSSSFTAIELQEQHYNNWNYRFLGQYSERTLREMTIDELASLRDQTRDNRGLRDAIENEIYQRNRRSA